ncbi:DIRC2 [Mytilus edulis]|uniref:DIRC2 n=1 Tax=Mytilus edulis TaxID=6550 RepID=A0A8S3RR46_MYTED|nr:DIRC2 [Mytilus edulis]
MDENEPLINKSGDKTIIIYTRRWWVLAIFSLNCFMQAIIWNTWGPIAQSAKEVFGWDDGQLGMLPNWGNIGFIATVIFASYIMDEKGPQLVSAPKYNHSSATGPSQSNDLTTDISVTTASYDNHTKCMAAGALFIAGLIYFPDKPPTPPSYTASVKRIEYTNALGKIIRSGPVWLISLAYALPAGVYGVWGSVLDVILNPVGVSQAIQIYISCIIGCIFLNGGIPLFYELSCEVSYPIAEGITGAFLTLLNNSFGVMFLLALQIPNIGTSWMNWTLLGSIAVGLLFMFAFPESYGRTDLDMEIDIPAPTEEEKSIVFIPNGSNKIIVNDDILTTTHDIAST